MSKRLSVQETTELILNIRKATVEGLYTLEDEEYSENEDESKFDEGEKPSASPYAYSPRASLCAAEKIWMLKN